MKLLETLLLTAPSTFQAARLVVEVPDWPAGARLTVTARFTVQTDPAGGRNRIERITFRDPETPSKPKRTRWGMLGCLVTHGQTGRTFSVLMTRSDRFEVTPGTMEGTVYVNADQREHEHLFRELVGHLVTAHARSSCPCCGSSAHLDGDCVLRYLRTAAVMRQHRAMDRLDIDLGDERRER